MVTDQEIRTGAFHLVGEDVSRADLAVRRETKCVLQNADVGKFRKLLEGNARRLIHNEPVSTVRSIYFDDVRLSDCQANLDGISPRRKVRLRWYDSLTPGEVLFFEVKWRENRVTGKHRLELRARRGVGELTFRQLIDELIEVLPPEHVADLLRRSEPVVLVEYRREHFASADGRLRVTLDYDLAFYDQTGKRSISTSFPCRLPEMFVVETKGPEDCQREMKELLHPFAPRMGPCSKYVHGCCQLGLVPPRNYH
jgi:hypothetical protein